MKTLLLLLCVGAALFIPPAIQASATGDITAISSRVSEDYVRAKRANGSFEPETYAFGPGGHWAGAISDASIDSLKFADVARTIAGPLANQDYLPAKDPKNTKLLIMVYWGTTIGAGDPQNSIAYQNLQFAQAQVMTLWGAPTISFGVKAAAMSTLDAALGQAEMENRLRDRANYQNACMLGYDSAGVIGTDYGRHLLMTAFRHKTVDLTDEIEDNRYFVVLMAYDFQLMWKEKKHKLLWETRFSIRQRHNEFDKTLAAMADYASKYFGQDSHGLIRKPLPEGHVELGDAKVIEVVPGK